MKDRVSTERIVWPPPYRKERKGGANLNLMRNGEPVLLELIRDFNDRALRTGEFTSCCDCHLVHHVLYEVFRKDGSFWLKTRAYRESRATDLERAESKRRKRPRRRK